MPRAIAQQYTYHISLGILKWSMVYTLVLFFFEDSRPFMVSSIFAPHWALAVLLSSLVVVLLTAEYADRKPGADEKPATVFEWWVYRVLCIATALFCLMALDVSFGMSIFIAGFFYVLYVASKKLI